MIKIEKEFVQTLNDCIKHANQYYDGHFTLMKFTTNWGFCFDTLEEINPITTEGMGKGDTPEEAMKNGLNNKISANRILKKVRSKPGLIKVRKKIGRNELCPCGSGEIYKKCCGKNKHPNSCVSCGSKRTTKKKIDLEVMGKTISDVPAMICYVCGQVVVDSDVIERVERLALNGKKSYI